MSSRSTCCLALACLVPLPSLGVWLGLYAYPGEIGSTLWSVTKVALFVTPVLWWRFVDAERLSLSPLRDRRGLLIGLATGLAIAAAVVGTFQLLESRIDSDLLIDLARKNRLDEPDRYIAVALFLTLVNSLAEEYTWRWFVYVKAAGAFRANGPAIVASALAFTLHHTLILHAYFDPWVVALGGAGVFSGGLIWSALYAKYRSVWPGYLSHIAADVAVLWIGWQLIDGATKPVH